MRKLYTVRDGIACKAAAEENGYLVAVLSIPDTDRNFVPQLDPAGVTLRTGCEAEAWADASNRTARLLTLVHATAEGYSETPVARAARIGGFAVAQGTTADVVWTERTTPEDWRLVRWQREHGRSDLARDNAPFTRPTACRFRGETVAAAECVRRNKPMVAVWNSNGDCLFTCRGRRPCSFADEERMALFVEETDRRGCALHAYCFDGASWHTMAPLPRVADRNAGLSAARSGDGTEFWLAWEGCPQWGWDERVGLHRDLFVFRLDLHGQRLNPAPGTLGGRLSLDPAAFWDVTPFNLPRIHPLLYTRHDGAGLAFRRFRPAGQKFFGWDILSTHLEGNTWSEPERLTLDSGPPDTSYAVLEKEGKRIVAAAACRHSPLTLFDPDTAPPIELSRIRAATDFRVELCSTGEPPVQPVDPPAGTVTGYLVPPSMSSVAEEPKPVKDPDGLHVLWGDIHAHSAYSKCMSCTDGEPADVLRYQRDVLGCRVLCLTDHLEYMSGPEFVHVLDCLETEAGTDCIPLYGVEYARPPAHHINMYAIDRVVFERLRCILLEETTSPAAFARIKSELPQGAVLPVRHFHGSRATETLPGGAHANGVVQLFDPELEVAMEALQMRGNMMTEPYPGRPFFPNNYLDSGARVGLVGGSDHARGFDKSKNRFGLTGFRVSDDTAEDVFAAMKARMTFACANGKIDIRAAINGVPAGSEVELNGRYSVDIDVSCARPLRCIRLLRNGTCTAEATPTNALRDSVTLDDTVPSQGRHWIVVYVEADSDLDTRPTVVFTSPFFVTAEP